MSWLILFIASVFEVTWAIGLKYSQGFTKLWPSAVTLVAMVLSVLL
jgi:quaternary ammonium compound-resistance protein SugE